jgi:hypothetical protein
MQRSHGMTKRQRSACRLAGHGEERSVSGKAEARCRLVVSVTPSASDCSVGDSGSGENVEMMKGDSVGVLWNMWSNTFTPMSMLSGTFQAD